MGFTSQNFPESESFFAGELENVRFYKTALMQELKSEPSLKERKEDLVAEWQFLETI